MCRRRDGAILALNIGAERAAIAHVTIELAVLEGVVARHRTFVTISTLAASVKNC